MTYPSMVTMSALLLTAACTGGTCRQRDTTVESSENGESPPDQEGERDDAPDPLPEAIGRWDGQSVRTNCLFPIDSFELPAWDQCHVAEAIASVGGLCLDTGGQRCMRPCRLDVGYVDREGLASQAHLGYDQAGRLRDRMVDSPLAQGTDGSIDLVYRWHYDEEGRLERLEEWIADHPMTPDQVPVLTQWSLYLYDERDYVSAIESYRAAQPSKSYDPDNVSSKSITSFRRDESGRIVERLVDSRIAGRVNYDEEAGGRISSYVSDVVRIVYQYGEKTNRLERIEHRLVDGGVPENDLLAFGARNEVKTLDFPRGSVTAGYRFEYDDRGRLVAELPTGPTDPTRRIIRWIYDCEETEQ